jgi:hypothetical protein
MTRDDIIAMAQEAGMALGFTQGIAVMNHENLERLVTIVEDAQSKRMFEEGMVTVGHMRQQIAAERNKLAHWMMAQGYATGHGDTTEDLLKELEWQVRESEREACAKVCDRMEQQAEGTECCKWPTPVDCAHAIRARGQE